MSALTHYTNPIENVYFEIEKAKSLNFINTERANKLYKEIDTLLLEQVNYFNHNASTSLSKHTFMRILKTINYVFVHGFRSIANRYQALNDDGIHYFFDQGINVIEANIQTIQSIYHTIKTTQLPFQNDRYKNIIDEQIPNYLKTVEGYYAIYYYCYTEYDLDYPLLDGLPLYHDMYHLQGSDLVLYYAKRFYLENAFCSYFKEDIPTLIYQYEQLKGIEVEFVGVNILELLLNQLVANHALQRYQQVFLRKDELVLIKTKLAQVGCYQMFKNTLKSISAYFPNEIMNYIKEYKRVIIRNLESFLQHDFETFIYEKPIEDKQIIILNMTSNKWFFQQALTDLCALDNVEDKIAYIKKKVMSVYDIIDLLETNVFYDEEYTKFYAQLEPQEIAILLQVNHKDITSFHQTIHLSSSFYNEFDTSITWIHYLILYLQQLEDTKIINEIEQAIMNIQIQNAY